MSDRYSKSHPWRVALLRDVVSVMRFSDGTETRFQQSAGERMCRTRKEADQFRAAIVAEHGADYVGPVYRA